MSPFGKSETGESRKGTPLGVPHTPSPPRVILSEGAKRRSEGSGYLLFALAVALSVANTTPLHAQKDTHELDRNEAVFSSPRTPCRESEWQILDEPQTKALLADYGYEEHLPWNCEGIRVAWLPTARIVRLHATVQLDDYRSATLLQSGPNATVWLIPTYFGMVGFPRTEEDPHNIAAFNDLLRAAKLTANENQLFDLCGLYQSILHMDEWINPERAPKNLNEAVQISDIRGSIERDSHGITVTRREPFGDAMTHTYLVWEFYFTNSGNTTHLSSVTRQTLERYNEDN